MFKITNFTCAILLISAPIFFKQNIALAEGAFSRSCTKVKVIAPNYSRVAVLTAECRRKNGSINRKAAIDLNDYIVNNNGTLEWQRGGDFQESCKESKIYSNHLLQSICKDVNQGLNYTVIDLNENILNDDGVLKYVGP